MTDAYIYDALRTPRGKGRPTGALYEVKPVELLSRTLTALKVRTDLDESLVEDVIMGCVTPVGDQGFNIARAALLHAGWSHDTGAMQINRYCTSGLEAVNIAAMKIQSGMDALLIAGGIESMSRVPMGSDGGAMLFDPDLMAKSNYIPQGVSADLIATKEGFTREMLDAYALQSQQRAHRAWESGYFEQAIVPIYDHNGLCILARDEYDAPAEDTEALSMLPPAFAKVGALGFDDMALHRYPEIEQVLHTHTAGSSSRIVDGAALVLLGNEDMGHALGLRPRARIRAVANAATEPTIMLTGPAAAARKALLRAGMVAGDIDLWECNEAFAAVALKFQRDMKLSDEVLNVNGGAIALGHPLGATGAILLGVLLDELERRDLKTGLVTLCAGGGMAVATIIERV